MRQTILTPLVTRLSLPVLLAAEAQQVAAVQVAEAEAVPEVQEALEVQAEAVMTRSMVNISAARAGYAAIGRSVLS